MILTIRHATITDVPDLRRVAITTQIDTFGAYNTEANMKAYLDHAYSLENLTRELTDEGSQNYLAFYGEELAGFARLRKSQEADHLLGTNTLEMQRLYVLNKYHGKKIGAALMREAIRFASQQKIEWLWLGVWERNFRAQEFYARWGFVRFSEHVFQMGDDPQTDWLLKKKM